MNNVSPNVECCPQFDPIPWNDKIFEWENKRFIKDRVFAFLNMPINFGQVMKRLDKKVKAAEATIPDWMCLSEHISKWKMDVYLAVDKEVPNAENVTLGGKYFSKVYKGPYKHIGKWCRDYLISASRKGLKVKKFYMWYTTCPKCAKKYGKNYVVIIAKVEQKQAP